ncbi:antibiotic biosynthesis monooxygenase [Streptomyces sp. NPDC021093]|uniref:antibiotic biosynthesis monooxygenase n=1 Tax=Streptomyces sp. NPDC021093 TaxID=3365112 RepID=UPI00379A174A
MYVTVYVIGDSEMTVGFIAFHYPRPEHFEDFIGRAHQVGDSMRAAPGCLSAEIWATPDGDAVVSTGRFESDETFKAAFTAARGLGDVVAFDERELKPRQIFTLLPK